MIFPDEPWLTQSQHLTLIHIFGQLHALGYDKDLIDDTLRWCIYALMRVVAFENILLLLTNSI